LNKKIVKVLTAVLIVGAVTTFTGCDEIPQSADKKDQVQQEQMLKQTGLGLPNIINFQEKKLMKNIMEQCDKTDLICYVYTYDSMNGKYSYDGKCIGFGLPYGTEYTNPQKIAGGMETPSTGNITLPQADPNGLFKPTDVNATWIMMIDEVTGERYLRYAEPDMTITAHKMPKRRLNMDSVPSDY
jgi:hypothetical protein